MAISAMLAAWLCVWKTAKKLAPTRPHPNSPNNEVFHKLVGPGVGLMDRVRDKLTGRTTG